LLPGYVAAGEAGTAKIVTQNSRSVQCISGVVIDEIDGLGTW